MVIFFFQVFFRFSYLVRIMVLSIKLKIGRRIFFFLGNEMGQGEMEIGIWYCFFLVFYIISRIKYVVFMVVFDKYRRVKNCGRFILLL